jgi:hypothetical protein
MTAPSYALRANRSLSVLAARSLQSGPVRNAERAHDSPGRKCPHLRNHLPVKQNLPLLLHVGLLSTELSNLHLISF